MSDDQSKRMRLYTGGIVIWRFAQIIPIDELFTVNIEQDYVGTKWPPCQIV